MNLARRIFVSLFLAAVLAGPVAITAAATPGEAGVTIRVYDSHHKDYHNWDDRENHAWGVYLSNNHRSYHEYKRAKRREREEYWEWRHQHPD